MHERVVHTLNDLVVSEQIKCNDKIRRMAMRVTNLDSFNETQKALGGTQRRQLEGFRATALSQPAGAKKAQHTPNISSADADLLVTSEEACKVILLLQARLNKQRTFWDIRYQLMKEKFEDKIQLLQQNLSSNQALWEGMKIGEQRQKVLQQELGITQKAAQQNEKLIGKLKEEF